jgi:signal peptidase II
MNTRNALIISVTILALAADQVAKVVARSLLDPTDHIETLGGFLTFLRVENEGAFLGLGSSISPVLRQILFIGLPAVALILAVVYMFRSKNSSRLFQVGLALLVGGGLGNLFDRIVYGSVTDFLFMDFRIFHTGIFNVGDMAIMAGVAMLLIGSWRRGGSSRQQQEAGGSTEE